MAPYKFRKKLKKPFRRYRPRTRYNRKKNYPLTRFRFGSNNIGLPLTKVVKLQYFQNVQFSTTAGVLASYIFDMSSVFDPDYSGVGHSPYSSDSWSGVYSNYEVLGSKISVKWCNNATNAIPHTVGVVIDKDATLLSTNTDNLKELQHGRAFSILPANSNANRTTTAYYSPKVIYGTSATNNHQFKAAWTSNPSLRTFAILVAQASDYSTSSTANMTAQVHIEYITRMSSPVELPGS